MEINKSTNCKDTSEAVFKKIANTITPKSSNKAITVSEVATPDDYEPFGLRCFDNNASDLNRSEEIKKWKAETNKLAWHSTYAHIAELPLKLIAYIASNSEAKDSLWSRGLTTASRLADTIGGMYRNRIYNRKDDNLGAVQEAQKQFGDTKTEWFSRWNFRTQIYGRFIVPALSLINPELANDIDSGLIGALDSSWMRKMSLNSGFYPGVVQDLCTKWFGGKTKAANKEYPPSWKFIKEQFFKHWESTKNAWRDYKNENNQDEKDKKLLGFSKYMDQVTSIIMPLICLPSNLVGDTIRPLLRRLNIKGPLRSIIRILSVADRSLLGINYVFRFFIPERIVEKQKGITTPFKSSNLYLGSLVGDIADLPLTIFEDQIKEAHPFVQHTIEIMRIIKNTAFNTFWSTRRIIRTEQATSKQSH